MGFHIPCRPPMSPFHKITLHCLKVLAETAPESLLRISLFPKKDTNVGYFSVMPQKVDSLPKKPPPGTGKTFSSFFCTAVATHSSPSMIDDHDELLCLPGFTKISSNDFRFIFSGDLAHESDQRTLQRCIRWDPWTFSSTISADEEKKNTHQKSSYTPVDTIKVIVLTSSAPDCHWKAFGWV